MRTLSNLTISPEICAQNRYVDPIALEQILADSQIPRLPENPNDSNLANLLNDLIQYLSRQSYYIQRDEQELGSRIVSTGKLQALTMYASQWIKGQPLAKMLDNSFINSKPDEIDSAISMIEGKVAYSLPNLLAPVYGAKGVDTVILTCMEAGSFNPFTRKLMDLGIARETALKISEEPRKQLITPSDTYQDLVKFVKLVAPSLEKWDRIQIPFLE